MATEKLLLETKKLADPARSKNSEWFFKTKKGEYGFGDKFLGLNMPTQRMLAKRYSDLSLKDLQALLKSKFHEHRMIALLILTLKYRAGDEIQKEKYFKFYIQNYNRVNNWDLVDATAPYIAGDFLLKRDKKILFDFAKSDHLWKKRISIIATFAFIKKRQFDATLAIAKILLNDNHDLIHKAVGWMLREVGNVDLKTEEKFLLKHYRNMPRTMLRYAIERFDEPKRKFYLLKS